MKKMIYLIIFIVSILILAACTTFEHSYDFENKTYTNKKVKVNYPQLIKSGDIKWEKAVNGLIEKEALKVLKYYEGSIDKLGLDINYSVKLKSPNILSIAYSGMGYVEGAAHPTNLFYTTNINLDKLTLIRLKDFLNIDNELINKLRKAKYIAWDSEPNPDYEYALAEYFKDVSNEDLIKSLTNADSLDYIGTSNQSDSFSYFTSDSLGISLSVPHVLGDHVEFELKYDDIKNNLKHSRKVFKE